MDLKIATIATIALILCCCLAFTDAEKCGKFEMLVPHQPICEQTCFNQCPLRSKRRVLVVRPTCVCLPGYVRRQGECVPLSYCSRPKPSCPKTTTPCPTTTTPCPTTTTPCPTTTTPCPTTTTPCPTTTTPCPTTTTPCPTTTTPCPTTTTPCPTTTTPCPAKSCKKKSRCSCNSCSRGQQVFYDYYY